MSRPKANILQSTRDHKDQQWDIIEETSYYVILYNGKPFNLRQHIFSLYNSGYKYHKLSYCNLAAANNMVNKLNKLFQTTLFSVKHIT